MCLDNLTMSSNIRIGIHKYASLFSKQGFEILSVANYISFHNFLRRNTRDKEMIAAWKKGIAIHDEGLKSCVPFCYLPYLALPLLDSMLVASNCLKYCAPPIKKVLKKAGFLNPDIVFITNIQLLSMLKLVKPKVIIMRIADRVEGFGLTPKTILEVQKEAIKKSNYVFVTSKNLYEEVKELNVNDNIIRLPNGVDRDFIKKDDKSYPVPEEYKNISKPIVFYVGAISDWFDYDVYEYGLSQLQDFSFVMVGPILGVQQHKSSMKIQDWQKKYKNFYYLGVKKHDELPSYLAHSHVGLIPFTITPMTNEINPIKLFEYAAYGLPVVASNMEELEDYKDNVFRYKNENEFVQLLLEHSKKDEIESEKQIQFARDNTWEKRFDYMYSIIKDQL